MTNVESPVTDDPQIAARVYQRRADQQRLSLSSLIRGKSLTDNRLLNAELLRLMQLLLTQGAGKRDIELRRSLAYLYGDLGHTASSKGKKKDAANHFKSAAKMWQSLITKIGNKEEFTEGLKWSTQRYREAGGS